MVDKTVYRKIVDSIWGFNIKCFAEGSINKFKAWLVVKSFSFINRQEFEETFTWVVWFDFLLLLVYIIAVNSIVLQKLDFKAANLYAKLKQTIELYLDEGSRAGNEGTCQNHIYND
jgi:hypothetical protein